MAERVRSSRILVGRGARQTESLLLARLEEDLDRLGPVLLERPALLVVPSQSLRHHLLTTLAARRPAIAGLWCRTLYGLAAELMRQAGMPLPGPLVATPERVAGDIIRAVERKKDSIYTPWFWSGIMLIIRSVPGRIFKRLAL